MAVAFRRHTLSRRRRSRRLCGSTFGGAWLLGVLGGRAGGFVNHLIVKVL